MVCPVKAPAFKPGKYQAECYWALASALNHLESVLKASRLNPIIPVLTFPRLTKALPELLYPKLKARSPTKDCRPEERSDEGPRECVGHHLPFIPFRPTQGLLCWQSKIRSRLSQTTNMGPTISGHRPESSNLRENLTHSRGPSSLRSSGRQSLVGDLAFNLGYSNSGSALKTRFSLLWHFPRLKVGAFTGYTHR